MKAALGLLQARPASGPSVLVRRHRAGLRLAADALVALFEQRVDGNVVLGDILVNPLLLDEGERCDLGSSVARLPGDHRRVRSLGGLLAADPSHPRVITLERPLKRLNLANLAAEVRAARPHLFAVTLDGLSEQETRVYGKNRDVVRYAGEHIQ